ncbi:MAG: hypothetical protein GF364_12045 [Candidatus Lokiarchaeota archaeon]|nr:hypothetical protein [Candidatus Lokiarchaeota archaeon]
MYKIHRTNRKLLIFCLMLYVLMLPLLVAPLVSAEKVEGSDYYAYIDDVHFAFSRGHWWENDSLDFGTINQDPVETSIGLFSTGYSWIGLPNPSSEDFTITTQNEIELISVESSYQKYEVSITNQIEYTGTNQLTNLYMWQNMPSDYNDSEGVGGGIYTYSSPVIILQQNVTLQSLDAKLTDSDGIKRWNALSIQNDTTIDHGNTISKFSFASAVNKMNTGDKALVNLVYEFVVYSKSWTLDYSESIDYSTTDSTLYNRYTQADPMINKSHPDIVALATGINNTYSATQVYQKINAAWETTLNTLDYSLDYPLMYGGQGGEWGAVEALAQGKGDCSDYSNLFVAILRSCGIPAREIFGLAVQDFLDDETPRKIAEPETGWGHAWTEVYVPDVGWIIFDPTWGDAVNKIPGFQMLWLFVIGSLACISIQLILKKKRVYTIKE